MHVCFCENENKYPHTGMIFHEIFYKLSRSWAPGSAGWRALLNSLLKLVFLCVLDRDCVSEASKWLSCLTTQFWGRFFFPSVLVYHEDFQLSIETTMIYIAAVMQYNKDSTVSRGNTRVLRHNVTETVSTKVECARKGKGHSALEIPYW